jgi:poly(3-hydroxybutyrate) depolymerase
MASRGEVTPLSMTMMGGPIDARKSPTAVNNLAMNKSYNWFENNVIYRVPTSLPGAGRRVYPGFLQHTGFVAMNPDRHMSSHYDYFKNLIRGDDASADAHRKFYDEYNAVLDMDATTISRPSVWCSRNSPGERDLGRLQRHGQDRARASRRHQDLPLTSPSKASWMTSRARARPRPRTSFASTCPKSHQKHLEVKGAGHYGIFAGRRWRETVYPQVRDFILKFNDGPTVKVAAKKARKEKVSA